MKLNRPKLLNILAAAKPGLAKKEIIQQAAHFIFTGDAVATYNDLICIVYPYETDFRCSVHGEEFYRVLDSIKEDEVDIAVEDGQLLINSKKTKAGLSTLVGDEERVEKMIDSLREKTSGRKFWKNLPDGFSNGVFLCMFAASKDLTTGVRCCVAVKDDRIYSTDSIRLSRYIMDDEIEGEMLIPATAAYELVKYPIEKYGYSEGWVHFLTKDGVEFNCRTMVGVYPYNNIVKFFRDPREEITLPEELKDVLKVAAMLATGDVDTAKSVEITIDKDKITCKSEKERGWMIKTVDLEDYDGRKIIFWINPILFAQILEKTTSFFVVQKEDFPDKAYFTTDSYQHVIALPSEEKDEDNEEEEKPEKKKGRTK